MLDFKARILVVDDMMTMRKIIIKMMTDFGYSDFTEAADGAKGWELLQKANPPFDLVLSDINMPHMTGIEFLQKARADEKFREVPFMFLTAEADLKTVHEAITISVTSYILKPVSPVELKKKLAGLPGAKKAG